MRRLEGADVVVSVVHEGRADSLGRREPDWVRDEIVQAFRRGVPVVPVLLDDVRPPVKDELPEDIREFAVLRATRLRAVETANS
ncbi:TIR domain-containing protein [Actinosynnema pretiosum subsp. pretiosum]|uniref:TIR domain-containing protein n=1 Tax=Actinosynnema pretiosum subsp. pretiosum TaxID=103721 RepID=A0AA45L5T9_9PSEU|nr:hypothetical protein APASM_4816 [Actinosynnema pretiosum subsp. pretiosum]QUF03862.1 TIR domain-containing protein [Actinosynnema pretiosum subsp. pretiosum]